MAVVSKNKREINPKSDIKGQNLVRLNGLSYPLHPLQIIAWTCYLLFSVVYFVFIVPALPTTLLRVTTALFNLLILVVHFVIHVTAVHINPADDNVIDKLKTIKANPANFDRSKHSHVIENQFCYICEANVGPKSKHCSVCNKCISDFDHHCKWLNNCVGGKNYRWFVYCVISALIGCLNVLISSIVLVIAYFSPISWLYNKSSTLLFFNNAYSGVQTYQSLQIFWIVIIIIVLILSLIACILLSHLLGFHLFLYCIGLSTYEFVVRSRSPDTPNNALNSANGCMRNLSQLQSMCQTVSVCRTNKRVQPTISNVSNADQSKLSKTVYTQKTNSYSNDMNKVEKKDESNAIQNEINNREIINEQLNNIHYGNKIKVQSSPKNDSNAVTNRSENMMANVVSAESCESVIEEESENHNEREEPIFRPLNPRVSQSGRMSRLSFTQRNESGPRSATPESGYASNANLFIRYNSYDKLIGNNARNVRLNPLTRNLSHSITNKNFNRNKLNKLSIRSLDNSKLNSVANSDYSEQNNISNRIEFID